MVQEGVHSLSRMLLQGQRPAVLLRRLEPSHQCRDKIVGQSAGTNHPPHRSRRRRGVEFDHDNRGEGIRRPEASLAPTMPVPGWVPIPRASTKKVRKKVKGASGTKRRNSRVLSFPVFWKTQIDSIAYFKGLTIFRQRVPKIQAMFGISPCYSIVKKRARCLLLSRVIVIYIYIDFFVCETFLYRQKSKKQSFLRKEYISFKLKYRELS